jgi:hypothetical protein
MPCVASKLAPFDHPAGLLIPIADEVSPARDSPSIDAAQRLDILIAEPATHELVAQERRIPHYHRGFWPGRFSRIPRVTQVEDGVTAVDVRERPQNRVSMIGKPVREHPLDLADPDDDPREFRGVRIQLDAQHSLRTHLWKLHGRLEGERSPEDGLALEILERLQREVEEVAGATGRVEDPDGAQAIEERVQKCLGVLVRGRTRSDPLAFRDESGDARLRLLEVPAERDQHHGLDQSHDGGPVGVMGPELRALARVEAALEEGAEDGRLHLGPVQVRHLLDQADLFFRERQHVGAVEESTLNHCMRSAPKRPPPADIFPKRSERPWA